MKRISNVLILFVLLKTQIGAAQSVNKDSLSQTQKKNYIATSVFVLSSLIPDDNTFFYEIDYGHKLNSGNDLIIGVDIYQYAFPLSAPWKDAFEYPGKVISYGIVGAYQHYLWQNFFIDLIFNPLILNYNNPDNNLKQNGFMLLLATRVGYHYDFKMFSKPFYLEVGAEISYWPVNTNVPEEFKVVDDKYNSHTFSPALQFGYKF